MSFDKIFDLTAGVHFFVIISCDTALLEGERERETLSSHSDNERRFAYGWAAAVARGADIHTALFLVYKPRTNLPIRRHCALAAPIGDHAATCRRNTNTSVDPSLDI